MATLPPPMTSMVRPFSGILSEGHFAQELDPGHEALVAFVLALAPHARRLVRADADEHGLVSLGEELVERDVDAEALVVADLDAEGLDARDLGAKDLARQAVVGIPTAAMPPPSGRASKTVLRMPSTARW